MIDTLQKMSGTRHRVYRETKTVTRDMERLFLQNEGKISETYTVKEEPVISYNNMAFINERNSIVFRAGDSPIWNRNETILPMSWRLFSNTIVAPGKDFSLQTIPTLSSAMEFDVRKNQPDFIKMWEKRREQAGMAEEAMARYREAYGYSDYDIEQLDPDNYADDIMTVINRHRATLKEMAMENMSVDDSVSDDEDGDEVFDEAAMAAFMMSTVDDEDFEYEDNEDEMQAAISAADSEMADRTKLRYAGETLSRDHLISKIGGINHAYDEPIIRAFRECRQAMFEDGKYFMCKRDSLYSADGTTCYIKKLDDSESLKQFQEAAKDPDSPVYSEDESLSEKFSRSYEVQKAFIEFLVRQETWLDFANGKFDAEMRRIIKDTGSSADG